MSKSDAEKKAAVDAAAKEQAAMEAATEKALETARREFDRQRGTSQSG